MRRKFMLILLLVLLLIIGLWLKAWWGSGNAEEIIADPAEIARLLPEVINAPNDWPGWRGPTRDGHTQGKPPQQWSSTQSIAWKKPVPGTGLASPITWQGKVFLLTADASQGSQTLFCYNQQNGEELWQKQLAKGSFPKIHAKNSHASSTPICDGLHVYCVTVIDEELRVSAVTLEGNIAWQTVVGPYLAEHGYGSSPVLCGGLLILPGESALPRLRTLRKTSYLAGLNRQTGKLLWRTARPPSPSYGTPIITQVNGQPELVHPGSNNIAGYEPFTGKLKWQVNWNCLRAANTPVSSNDNIYVCTNATERLCLAIPKNGTGDLSKKLRWKNTRSTSDVSSPILIGETLYIVEDNGILHAVDTKTGETLYKARLGSGENVTASPIFANGLLYVATESGKTFIIRPGLQYDLVRKNDLGEPMLASPAVSGNDLLLRTANHLWCVRESAIP